LTKGSYPCPCPYTRNEGSSRRGKGTGAHTIRRGDALGERDWDWANSLRTSSPAWATRPRSCRPCSAARRSQTRPAPASRVRSRVCQLNPLPTQLRYVGCSVGHRARVARRNQLERISEGVGKVHRGVARRPQTARTIERHARCREPPDECVELVGIDRERDVRVRRRPGLWTPALQEQVDLRCILKTDGQVQRTVGGVDLRCAFWPRRQETLTIDLTHQRGA